jgi:Golgi apyrase
MTLQKYGIVIDSGSSGSRVQIYSWPDSQEVKKRSKDSLELRSVPQVHQQEDWNEKITPGVSTFDNKPDDVWDHYEPLIEYAENIIPKDQWNETPIFVLATAGMRLLPEKKRNKLLDKICHKIQKKSDFKLENCSEQVQIIDGETEGLYGWIGLNYLMGRLENYDPNGESHMSYGFMDMGGASTQISFVPNKQAEIDKHKDDISTLYLRNVDGSLQKWDVFVSTWLGFGANEARKRYLKNLINILPEKNNDSDEDDYATLRINDPCLPRGAQLDFSHHGHSYDIIGSGDYEECLKTTYPLLLKNLPCTDTPCLFNGVHAPEIDFEKDKFVGISEYWYTANDVFHMGGEYNFAKFSEKVQMFCESDWDSIMKNSEKGDYNNLPTSLLTDACFKANWVINVLHEGFNLPRIGIEQKMPSEVVEDFDNHIPFQSAGSIKGAELSWTLGRIILYASSMIAASDSLNVGIQPAENEHKEFIAGGISKGIKMIAQKDQDSISWLPLFLILLLFITFVYFFTYRRPMLKRLPSLFTQAASKLKNQYLQYRYMKVSTEEQSDLEAGVLNRGNNDTASGSLSPSLSAADFNSLRTRSYANLQGQKNFAPKKNLRNANSLLDLSNFKNGEPARPQSTSALSN